MNKFTSNLLLFILPIVIIGVSAEILLRKIPNDYLYKKEYLDRNMQNSITPFFELKV